MMAAVGVISLKGHAIDLSPEAVFLAAVLISVGLRMWRQGSIWWHHVLDVLIGAVAVTAVPRFGADVSTVTVQSWAAYGLSAVILALTVWLLFPKLLGKKK